VENLNGHTVLCLIGLTILKDGRRNGLLSCESKSITSGEVQRILMFLQKGSDLSGNGSLYWQPMSNIQLTYNGEAKMPICQCAF